MKSSILKFSSLAIFTSFLSCSPIRKEESLGTVILPTTQIIKKIRILRPRNNRNYYRNLHEFKNIDKKVLKKLEPDIDRLAIENNLCPNLIKAIIAVESRFKTNARSNKGAIGLMQIMPSTAKFLRIKNPYNTLQNLEGGIRYLNLLNKMFNGNEELVIAAYNAGQGRVIKYGGIPPLKETQEYVIKVKRARELILLDLKEDFSI